MKAEHFQIFLMIQYFIASVLYLIQSDYLKAMYWCGALIITIPVLLMK